MASWYEKHIVPKIIGCCCGMEVIADQRRKVVPRAKGRVLELGIGAGHNLAFYDPKQVSQVVGIEPSEEFRHIASRAERPKDLNVDIVDGVAEVLPFKDGEFDSVVCTFTLCSVQEPDRVLAEARRVLRKDGSLHFVEHGRSPDAGIARWQGRLEPLWKRMMGGCHLTRPVGGSIERFFDISSIERGYFPQTPRIIGWGESGEAIAR